MTVGFNANNRIPFVSDPNGQPTSLAVNTNEIDLIDPDYKYPSLIRTNLAYDRELGFFGLVGTTEFLYSSNVNDVRYENLNLVQTGTRPDGRPVFTRNRVAGISDMILLTNTSQGDSWSIVFKVDRPYRNRMFMSGSYLYGRSRAILDGQSSQAASNWGNVYVPGDPNNPPLTRSNFDPGHRITISGGYDIPVPGGLNVVASVFYSGQSGRPWSVLYGNDYNGDVRTTNDLLYIPRARTKSRSSTARLRRGPLQICRLHERREVHLRLHRQIQERNACRAPWTNTLDFRLNVGLPFKTRKGGDHVGHPEPDQPVRQPGGAVRVRQLQRPAGRRLPNPAVGTDGKPIYNIQNIYLNGELQTPEQRSPATICVRGGRCSSEGGSASRRSRIRYNEARDSSASRAFFFCLQRPVGIHHTAGPHPRGYSPLRFARGWLLATARFHNDICLLPSASCLLPPASFFDHLPRSLDGLPQVVLIDLDADEIEAELARGDRGAAEPEERIHHEATRDEAVQAQAGLRHARRERRRMRAVLVAALDRVVGDEPGVATAPAIAAAGPPAGDVRGVLIGHADGAAVERSPPIRREMKDELVTVVEKAVAVDRLVVADSEVAASSTAAPAASRSMAIDLIQWMVFWSCEVAAARPARPPCAVQGSVGLAPTFRKSEPCGASVRAAAAIHSPVHSRYSARGSVSSVASGSRRPGCRGAR